MLGSFCWLYNHAVEERRDGWRNYGWSFNFFQQSAGLKYLRRRDDRLGRYSSRTGHLILRRVDLAFQSFFRRLKAGEKAGYPRFKPASRFDTLSLAFGNGVSMDGDRVGFTGIDARIKVKRHREMPSKPKTAILKREGSRWFLVCRCESEATPVERPYSPVGIDAGLTSLVALTTGEKVATPQFTKAASKRIRRNSRALARAVKGSKRRAKARARLAEAHRKAASQRRDFLHKLSRRIVTAHSHIAVEDLSIAQMTHSNLGKSIHNAAWATLREMLTYKAESAGSVILAVNPRGTSQTCSACGCDAPKTLKDRTHDCPHCGVSMCRDLNAAQNILMRARFTPGTGDQTRTEPIAA